jgi:3-deoxy-D-manno-octulosonic-acid transferase
VFGSLRAGEESVALRAARLLEKFRAEQGWQGAGGSGGTPPATWEGRSRALLVVAPRHASTEGRIRAVLAGGGFRVVTRSEPGAGDRGVTSWIDEASRQGGPRVALLTTRGELPEAYGSAWGAVVGGTFVSVGGHNAWEPASRGTPVLVGPYHHEVLAAVDAVVRGGGGAVCADADRHLDTILSGWLRDEDLESRGRAASRAAAAAAGAGERALAAIEQWGLVP